MNYNPTNSARTSDADTSHDAANSMIGVAEQHQELIHTILSGSPIPLAAEQISDRCDLDYVAINRRLPELLRAEKIVKTELKHTNRSGRSAYKYLVHA